MASPPGPDELGRQVLVLGNVNGEAGSRVESCETGFLIEPDAGAGRGMTTERKITGTR